MILSVVQDNIEAACSAIEKAAMDRAVADIDEQFATAYENRRRHREVCIQLARFWHVEANLILSSCTLGRHSGIQQPHLIHLPRHCLILYKSSQMVFNLNNYVCTKTLVGIDLRRNCTISFELQDTTGSGAQSVVLIRRCRMFAVITCLNRGIPLLPALITF